MDFSLPFRRAEGSEVVAKPKLSWMDDFDLPLGQFVDACVKAKLQKSMVGNGDRLKFLEEGASFKVYRSKVQQFRDDGSSTSTLSVVKILRGCPAGKNPNSYPQKQGYQLKQLEAIVREVQVQLHPPLRAHENILNILGYGFNTQGGEIEETEDESWKEIQPYLIVEYAEERPLRRFITDHPALDTSVLRELTLDMAAG